MYSDQLKHTILELAKNSIEERLNGSKSINREKLYEKYPEFKSFRGTFVTLNLDGELRGCIGSLIAHQTLLEDIISNAKKAAFEDPRFLPLSFEEFKRVDIEVSILSESSEVKYSNFDDLKSKIDIGIDGVIVKQGLKSATFLPQVWEQLPEFEDFLSHLLAKAGINDLNIPVDISVYQVEKVK